MSSSSTKSVSFDLKTTTTIDQGGLQVVTESWPRRLPHPPSMRDTEEDEMENTNIPMCVVFNANTPEGVTMVRVLSEKGLRVVAVVRVFAGKKVKQLIKLKRVVVKVADWNDHLSLMTVAQGCSRAFLISRYWEYFDSPLEEEMATNIVEAAACVGVKSFVMATFEDALELKRKGQSSQIEPDQHGRIYPRFEGMKGVDSRAKCLGMSLSHMMNSYWDVKGARKTLVLIRGPHGKVIVQPCYKDQWAPGGGDTSEGVGSIEDCQPSACSATTGFGFSPCRRWLKKGWGKQSTRRTCRRQQCPSICPQQLGYPPAATSGQQEQ